MRGYLRILSLDETEGKLSSLQSIENSQNQKIIPPSRTAFAQQETNSSVADLHVIFRHGRACPWACPSHPRGATVMAPKRLEHPPANLNRIRRV
jgi:hypothetical protein